MKKYIAVIDSGVGGLSVLNIMQKNFPKENYIYIGDNKNAPYGNKSINELKKLVFDSIVMLNDYNIKFLIVACNTLSCNILHFIKEMCNYPVYGVFPPFEKFMMENKSFVFLSTISTAEYYKHYIYSKKIDDKKIIFLSQKNLVLDIECNLFNLSKLNPLNYIKCPLFAIDNIILGCTHYNFVKKYLFDHFLCKKITCSEDLLVNFLISNNKLAKSSVRTKRNSVLFLGNSKEINKEFYYKVVKTMLKITKNN